MTGFFRCPPPVSLCLIAKNEEATLPNCLRPVAGLFKEVLVADTGSTDRTREIAAHFGARVIDFPWCDDFAAARNEALRHATGAWVFWLDADDRLDDGNRDMLAALFAGLRDENAAYVMTSRSPSAVPGEEATDVGHVRLFRNCPDFRWRYRVHEQILPALVGAGTAIRRTDIVIEHTGYRDPGLRRRKLERNLRLLHLDHADHPDEPYILFNLGWSYLDLGRPAEALPFLRQSLEHCAPGVSIVRKLYALLAQAHRRLGQLPEALAACRAGLARCPGDPELLLLEGALLQQRGDFAGAEARWLRLLPPVPAVATGGPPVAGEESDRRAPGRPPPPPPPEAGADTPHPQPLSPEGRGEKNGQAPSPSSGELTVEGPGYFASTGSGIRGFATRHRLALLYRTQGRAADAAAQWRAAVAERPEFAPAWAGLGELALDQQRWDDLDHAVAQLRRHPAGAADAVILQARGHLARREFAPALALLDEAKARDPQALPPRILLAHALLQEGRDPAAAERALRDVLAMAPAEAESSRNLAVLLRQQGRTGEAAVACRSGLVHCPGDLGLHLLHGLLLHELGDLTTAETCLVRVLEALPAAGRIGNPSHQAGAARHHLAQIYQVQRRASEAEMHWRAVLAERPDVVAAWLGLADLLLAQARWPEVEALASRLEALPDGAAEAAVVRARACLARREYEPARRLAEEAIAQTPSAVGLRLVLAEVLVQEGRDPAAAERALREVLALDPANAPARHHLDVLFRRQGHPPGEGETTRP
jgi:tetratricopeptide (TPR) repeat protein